MAKNWIKEIVDTREVIFSRYDTQYGVLTGIEYFATQNPDGTFNINTHEAAYTNIPYAGEFENYRVMDEFADFVKDGEFVCHIAHNDELDYVFVLPSKQKDYYISLYK